MLSTCQNHALPTAVTGDCCSAPRLGQNGPQESNPSSGQLCKPTMPPAATHYSNDTSGQTAPKAEPVLYTPYPTTLASLRSPSTLFNLTPLPPSPRFATPNTTTCPTKHQQLGVDDCVTVISMFPEPLDPCCLVPPSCGSPACPLGDQPPPAPHPLEPSTAPWMAM